jgi:N-acetyl sugar amidotransferase
MKYCTECLYPETKPDLSFDEAGVCSACQSFKQRANVDWSERANQFQSLVDEVKTSGNIYDCIVPVSGGKDSHYQLIKCLEYGLRPLAVTATTDDLSLIGRRNLNNISKLGVDHIEVSVNQLLRRKINAYTLREIGDISWTEHVTIFTIPVKEALLRSIPLIVWGENPQNEYGGPEAEAYSMKHSWLQEFGGLCGMRVNDLIDKKIGTPQDFHQYRMPELAKYSKAKYVFLGQYFPWNGHENAEIAYKHGFEFNPGPVEGCGVEYENLDNHQTGIHDYFKYLKFGFGRATDIACNRIRRKIITRNEGKEFVLEFDGRFPSTYLGKSLESILTPLKMSVDEFMSIADRYTNGSIFDKRYGPRPRLKHNIMKV